MKSIYRKWIVAVVFLLGAVAYLRAAPDNAPSEESAGGELLGPQFESESAGISLRIPAGCHRVASSGAGDEIGQFGDEKRQWQLKLTRMVTPKPTALTSSVDSFGKPVPGLLDLTVARLQTNLSACKVLRQDLTNIADGDPKVKDNVAMIAVRYTTAGAHYLSQQAIIQATDRLFYLIALTTPAGNASADQSDDEPAERAPVETFRQLLDSVRLMDTQKIRQEQDERLYRTRTLMLNWKNRQRLYKSLLGEQWLRVIRDGKDVGYSYITEQTAAGVPRPLKPSELKAGKGDRDLVQPGDGILIGIRARAINPTVSSDKAASRPLQIDTATWLFVTPDLHLEDWSRITVVGDGTVDKLGKPMQTLTEEFGSSHLQTVRSLDREARPGTALDPKQPPVDIRNEYVLDVTSISGSGADEPLERELPPFYLPQALSHLLPRLLPRHAPPSLDGEVHPRTYLFATYVPEMREVMLRYVDVDPEQEVRFAGKTVRAIPIRDRIGWHGSVTTHYISPEGKYLGSENKQTHTIILPTDAATLLSIWKNANLSQPGGTELPRKSR